MGSPCLALSEQIGKLRPRGSQPAQLGRGQHRRGGPACAVPGDGASATSAGWRDVQSPFKGVGMGVGAGRNKGEGSQMWQGQRIKERKRQPTLGGSVRGATQLCAHPSPAGDLHGSPVPPEQEQCFGWAPAPQCTSQPAKLSDNTLPPNLHDPASLASLTGPVHLDVFGPLRLPDRTPRPAELLSPPPE